MGRPEYQTFLAAPSSSSSTPIQPADISDDHQQKLDQIIQHFQADEYVLPEDVAEGHVGPLSDIEKTFLSREGLLRFLRADRFDVPVAIKRTEKCIAWRRKVDIDDLEGFASKVEGEFKETGGQLVFGFDKLSRPVIFMHPSRRQHPPSELGLLHLFFLLERAVDLMPKYVEKTAFLIDFSGKRKYSTPVGLAKSWVTVLQTCYPERLGVGIIANAPWALSMFLSLILPFCDPITREKIVVAGSSAEGNALIAKTIPADQLQSEYSGEQEVNWDTQVHEQYWAALISLCKKKREEKMRIWKELGGGIGVSENAWK